MSRPRVAGLLRRSGEVLLCHGSAGRRWYPDAWDLPSGAVAQGERPVLALAKVLAARLGVVIDLPAAAPCARVQGPGVDVHIFVVDDWSGFPRLSDRGEYDELAWVGWAQAETLRLADPRLLVLVKAALTTPEDYPHQA